MNSSELSAADIAAVTGNNNGGLFGGGDGSWLAILFLFAIFGWGRGGFGGGGGGKERMISQLRSMMNTAENEKEKESIQKCIKSLENA